MRLALFQPDIPQNTGALLRFAACMGLEVDIIEPCGFILDDRRLRRAGMDYLEHAQITLHKRSLNVAIAASMVAGEALRQTNEFPLKP